MGNKKYTDTLEPDRYYHVFNRGINGERIFSSHSNYQFFISKMQHHIGEIVDVFCYCLLPNHFHLLLRVKSEGEIMQVESNKTKSAQKLVYQKFSNFFNSYAQAYNKELGRTGKLFDLPFRRKNIEEEIYLRKTVLYIHQNPKKHGIETDIDKYPFSSFHVLISDRETFLKREEIIEWFDDKENFIYCNLNQL